MDARELRWELAALEADYKSQQKERDAASARDEVAAAQQSDLQMQRLHVKMQLINHRLQNLEIKSPIDGVVIAGDMKTAEGAPLTIGQTVFEIGPLDEMVVEIAVPERDILHVKHGMDVRLRLDADMQTTESGSITRLFPRSETRDAESVYIAEVLLPNRDGRLHPGMKGTAKIIAHAPSSDSPLFDDMPFLETYPSPDMSSLSSSASPTWAAALDTPVFILDCILSSVIDGSRGSFMS